MKHNFTKLFTLLIMAAMSMGVWADNVSIPQDLGSYIVVGSSTGAGGFASYITKNNCEVDSRKGDAGNSKYYTIGSTRADTKVDFHVTASAAGRYVFGFKSGVSGCSSVITVKMTKEGSDIPMYTSGDVVIADDGNWDPNIAHNLYIEDLEAANYTLSFEVKEITSGSYAGNFGNFFFHTTNQLAWPASSAYMEFSDGTFVNARDNSDNVISHIARTGGSIDDLLVYNSAANSPIFHFNIDSYKQESKVIITVTDFATGTQEAREEIVVNANGNYTQQLSTVVSAGLKKIRFDFADNDETADDPYLFNFRQVYFTLPEALPITSALNLNPARGAVYDNANWNESGEISYIKAAGASIDNLLVFNSNEGYYNFCFSISNIKQNSIVGVTITDVATSTIEINDQTLAFSDNGDKTIHLNHPLTVGLKKIRIDFRDNDPSNADTYLFNFKTVTIPAVTYDPLPLTGEAVLDLSQWPTSGNPRYEETNQNLGYIYHNTSAFFYVYNTNPTAHYNLSAGIRTNVSDANLVVTITDVATGVDEINAESFDVAAGNDSYPIQTFTLSNAITPGLKRITFSFTKDDETTSNWLYNIKNISFTLLPYTRTHKHMNLNTLCYPYQIDTYSGATFYTMLNKVMDGETVTDIYLQEHVGALEAGTPYFYVPEEGSAELVCYYSGDRVETPLKVNGVQGAYADNTAVPGGAFVTYNNNLRAVAEGYVTLGEYRAYVDMNEVPEAGVVAHLPGRKMLKIRNADAPAVATDLKEVQGNNVPCTKVIENGVLYLKYNGTKYNVQGMRVK